MSQFQFLSWFYNLRVNFLLRKVKGTAVTSHAKPCCLWVLASKGCSVSTEAGLGFLKLEQERIARRGRGVAVGAGSAPSEIRPPLYPPPRNCKTHHCWLGLGPLGAPAYSPPRGRRSVARCYSHFQQHSFVWLHGPREPWDVLTPELGKISDLVIQENG